MLTNQIKSNQYQTSSVVYLCSIEQCGSFKASSIFAFIFLFAISPSFFPIMGLLSTRVKIKSSVYTYVRQFTSIWEFHVYMLKEFALFIFLFWRVSWDSIQIPALSDAKRFRKYAGDSPTQLFFFCGGKRTLLTGTEITITADRFSNLRWRFMKPHLSSSMNLT